MLLRHYLERGVSKAALARRVGVSRKTIRSWIATGQLDRDRSSGSSRYSPRLQVPHKLALYTGIIAAGLEEFPELSAQRLFDEVRAAGYAGSYGGVRDYIWTVRPCPAIEPVVRFETPAGRQGQVELAGEVGDRGLVEEGGHGPRPRPGEPRRAPPRIGPYQQVAGLRCGADQPGMWTGVPVFCWYRKTRSRFRAAASEIRRSVYRSRSAAPQPLAVASILLAGAEELL